MISLIKELILAEVKINPDIISHICARAAGKPNYDTVYKLTYNQVAPQTGDLVSLMKEYQMVSGMRIMEIMAGNGFESKEVKNALPGNQYTCLDNINYFSPIGGLTYCTADCTDITYRHPEKQDLIFIGSANASMCMLLQLKDLLRLAIFLQHNVNLNGLAVLSYFEENNNATNFIIDYSVNEVKDYEYPGYNGLYAHWFSAVKCDTETQLHHYCDLVAVSADDELTLDSTYKEISYNTEPMLARSWQTSVVMEVMCSAGFKYVGSKWNPDTRFMPFQKIEEEPVVHYF